MSKRGWVVIASLVVGIGSVIPPPASAEDKPVQVIVQNPLPLPVDIKNPTVAVVAGERAGLHVWGSVDATQSGPWTVEVAGTPAVTLAPGAAVVVTHPAIFRRTLKLTDNAFTNTTPHLLVIDRVAGSGELTATGFSLAVGTPGASGEVLFFPGTPYGSSHIVNALTQIYMEPGQVLYLGISYDNYDMRVYLSGRYVPAPSSTP